MKHKIRVYAALDFHIELNSIRISENRAALQ